MAEPQKPLWRKIGDPVFGGIAGFGSSSTAGLLDLIPSFKEGRESLKKDSPIAHGLGVGLGFVPGGAVGVVGKILGKVGLTGAAKGASWLAPKISKVAPVDLIQKAGTKVGKKVAAKSIASMALPANMATQGVLWGTINEAGKITDPKEAASDTLQQSVKNVAGAGLGSAGVGAAFGITGKAGKLAAGAGRWAKEKFYSDQIWGISKAPEKKVAQLSEFFKPVIDKIEDTISPDQVKILELAQLPKGASYRGFSNFKEYWQSLKHDPKKQMNALTRYLALKYPDAKNHADLSKKLSSDVSFWGEKMGRIEDNAKAIFKSDPFSDVAYNPLYKVENTIRSSYDLTGKNIYKSTLSGKQAEGATILKSLNEFYKKHAVFDLKILNKYVKDPNDLRNIYDMDHMIKTTKPSLLKVYRELSPTFEKQYQRFMKIKKDFATVDPIQLKGFIRDIKKYQSPYSDRAGSGIDPKSIPLKDFIKKYDTETNKAISEVEGFFGGEYQNAVDQYAVAKRFYDIIGSTSAGQSLSYFIPAQVARSGLAPVVGHGAASAAALPLGVLASLRIKAAGGRPGPIAKIQEQTAKEAARKRGVWFSPSQMTESKLKPFEKLTVGGIKELLPDSNLTINNVNEKTEGNQSGFYY